MKYVTWCVGTVMALFSVGAQADDFYVSARMGSDVLDGHAAAPSGTAGPFSTLAPLQRRLWLPGDRILLRCGERFAGPVSLLLRGGGTGTVLISHYGNDCTPGTWPVIDGRVPLTGGAAVGGLVRFASPQAVAQVFEGDEPLPQGRFPDSLWQLVPASALPLTAALPPLLAPGKPLAGAVLHARTQEWTIEEAPVLDDQGRLGSALRYALRPKTGFYLTGKEWMLGSKRGWAYDATAQKLSVRATHLDQLTAVPAADLVRVSGKGSVTVDGLRLEAAGGDALQLKVSGGVVLNHLQINRAAGNGVAAYGARKVQLLSSSIQDVGLDAVFLAEVKNAEVRDNVVRRAGLYGYPRPSLAAINAHRTEKATVVDNDVRDSAYVGIRFSGDAHILRNYVARSCQLLSDCAGLYTWRRNPKDVRPASEVAWNIVDGARGDTAVKLGVNDWFAGIYLDESSNAVLVRNNLIVGVNQGIYLHNAFANEVRNNWVGAAKYPLLDKGPAEDGTFGVEKNKVSDNTLHEGVFELTFKNANGGVQGFEPGMAMAAQVRAAGGGASRMVTNCQIEPKALQGAASGELPMFSAVAFCE